LRFNALPDVRYHEKRKACGEARPLDYVCRKEKERREKRRQESVDFVLAHAKWQEKKKADEPRPSFQEGREKSRCRS